jgi:hypothetical protein
MMFRSLQSDRIASHSVARRAVARLALRPRRPNSPKSNGSFERGQS